jgi:hypothetical protein
MKFTNVFLILIAIGLISSVVGQFETVTRATAYSATDNGKLYYLDRHNLNCDSGEAMRSFVLQRKDRDSDEVRYKLDCVKAAAINKNEILTESTAYHQTWWWSDKCLNYLQYHNIICRTGYVLKSFSQGRSGDQLNFSYSCVKADIIGCRYFETPLNDIGSKQVWYLDRHNVGQTTDAAWVLQSFKLEVIGDNIKYSGQQCKLKDYEAIRAVDDAEAGLIQTYDNLRLEQVELTNVKKQVNINNEEKRQATQVVKSSTLIRDQSQEKLNLAVDFEAQAKKDYDVANENYEKSRQESKLSEDFLKTTEIQLINTAASNQNADEELKEANAALENAKEHIKISQQELSQSQEEYNTALNNISHLENNVQEKEKEQQLQQSTVEINKKNLADSKSRLADLNKHHSVTENDIKASAEVLVNAKSSIEANKETVANVEAELVELRRKLEKTETTVKEAGETLKLSKEYLEENEAVHQYQTGILASLGEEVEAEEDSRDNLSNTLSSSESELEIIAGEIFALDEDIKKANDNKDLHEQDLEQKSQNLMNGEEELQRAAMSHGAAKTLSSGLLARLNNTQNTRLEADSEHEENRSEAEIATAAWVNTKEDLKKSTAYVVESKDSLNAAISSLSLVENRLQVATHALEQSKKEQSETEKQIVDLTQQSRDDEYSLVVAKSNTGLTT